MKFVLTVKLILPQTWLRVVLFPTIGSCFVQKNALGFGKVKVTRLRNEIL